MGSCEPCPHCHGTGFVHTTYGSFILIHDNTPTFSSTDLSAFGNTIDRWWDNARELSNPGAHGQANHGWRHFVGFLRDAIEFVTPFVVFTLPPRRRYDRRSEPRWGRECWKAKT
jgi:hypothetical protein